MKKILVIMVVIFGLGCLHGQSIEDTHNQILSTKAELMIAYKAFDAQVQAIVKAYSPYEAKSEFDTIKEFQNKLLTNNFIPRMQQWPKIMQIEMNIVQPVKTRLDKLRFSTFYSDSVSVNPLQYNAEEQIWTMQIKHLGYKKESVTFGFPIPRDDARKMNANWQQVTARGVLGFDPNDEISLIQIILRDLESGIVYKHNLDIRKRFFRTDEVEKDHWFTFSHDQKNLIYEETINCSEYLSVKDLATGEKMSCRELNYGMENVTLSQDGRILAFVEAENGEGIHVINLPNAKYDHKIKGESYDQILISPDGRHLIYSTSSYDASSNQHHYIKIKELYSNLGAVLMETNKRISVLAFSPDCTKLLMGMVDGNPKDKLHEIDLTTLKIVHSYDLESIKKIKFSPDGKYIALSYGNGSRNNIRILNSQTYEELDQISIGLFHQFCFSSDSRYILKNSDGGRIYDLLTKSYVYDSKPSPEFIDSMFYPDERFVLEGTWISRTHLYIDPVEQSR